MQERKAKAEADRVRLESERKQNEIEDARGREEQAKLAAEKRASDAESKAKQDAAAEVVRERERVDAERKATESARLKREADQRLRDKVRSEIMADLVEQSASEIADAIMDGKVRHVKVVF